MSYQEALYVKGREEGEEKGEIKGTIKTSFRLGRSEDEVLNDLIQLFCLPQEEAQEYVDQFKPA